MTLQTHRIGDITRGINAPNLVCRICGNTKGNTVYHVRDMMFGYRDEFAYFQCSSCECLQINAFPSDMTRYYLSQYYSFVLINQREQPKEIMSQVSSYAQSYKNSYAAFGRGMVGRILYALSPNPTARERLRTLLRESFPPGDLENLGITPNSSLLDVGCGSGSRLLGLYGAGFRTLGGIDLYIESDTHYENGVQVLKRTIHEISGSWDVIMFHHSFEHLSDQVETIRSVARLLSKNGLCIIRIPTVTSYAWENYKEHWVQLDAPRHFYLHSIKSMQLLATRLGFRIERILYDSTGFQFWGSEQYSRDIPLIADHSYAVEQERSIFSKSEIERFEEKAQLLNSEGRGDQATFYLRK